MIEPEHFKKITILIYYERINDALDVNPEFIGYGSTINTKTTFRANIQGIIKHFQHIPILLCEYHTFYPEAMMKQENLGFDKEGKYFKANGPRTTSGAWGYPWNTIKAVETHNQILQELSHQKSNVHYVQTHSVLQTIHNHYFDVCHFDFEGGKVFANHLSDIILPFYH